MHVRQNLSFRQTIMLHLYDPRYGKGSFGTYVDSEGPDQTGQGLH